MQEFSVYVLGDGGILGHVGTADRIFLQFSTGLKALILAGWLGDDGTKSGEEAFGEGLDEPDEEQR